MGLRKAKRWFRVISFLATASFVIGVIVTISICGLKKGIPLALMWGVITLLNYTEGVLKEFISIEEGRWK